MCIKDGFNEKYNLSLFLELSLCIYSYTYPWGGVGFAEYVCTLPCLLLQWKTLTLSLVKTSSSSLCLHPTCLWCWANKNVSACHVVLSAAGGSLYL